MGYPLQRAATFVARDSSSAMMSVNASSGRVIGPLCGSLGEFCTHACPHPAWAVA